MPGPPPLQLGPQMGQLPPQLQPQIITQPAPPPQIQVNISSYNIFKLCIKRKNKFQKEIMMTNII